MFTTNVAKTVRAEVGYAPGEITRRIWWIRVYRLRWMLRMPSPGSRWTWAGRGTTRPTIWRRLPIRSFYVGKAEAIAKGTSAVAGQIRQQS